MNLRENAMFHSKMTSDEIRDTLFYAKGRKNILFLGICGTGMSALARLLKREGHLVLGYDRSHSGEYQRLLAEGIAVFHNEAETTCQTPALIVYSLAIPEHHPLLLQGVPNCSRAQLLGALMLDYPLRLAIAGTHGKSTVTSLVHRTLLALGELPTTLSGADLGDGRGPLFVGEKKIFLYECCEYQNSFLYTFPTHAVVLNLELDHTDFFSSMEELKDAFTHFINNTQHALCFLSDAGLSEITSRLTHPVAYYCDTKGGEGATYFSHIEGSEKGRYTYSFYFGTKKKTTLAPRIGGKVGVYNTLAALTLLVHLGYDAEQCANILSTLSPISRRLEQIGTIGSSAVYYDFAHHPTEIRTTIETLTERYGSPPTVIFAPHTYSRTRDLWKGFVDALSLAKEVYLCPITPARETPVTGVTSDALALAIGPSAHSSFFVSDLVSRCENMDGPIVLMGAGDLDEIRQKLTKMQTFIPICTTKST